jgi:ligand-binding sensor domain-containing protein
MVNVPKPQQGGAARCGALLAAILSLALLGGCSHPTAAPPENLRATLVPPPPPLAHLLSDFGIALLRLDWDPSPDLLADLEGHYHVIRISGERLDVRDAVATVTASQFAAEVPVMVSESGPLPLFEVVAESSSGGRSADSQSGLVVRPRFLSGTGLWHPGGVPKTLPRAPVRALHADSSGHLLVGYEGAGLARIDVATGALSRWATRNGLVHDTVTAAASDGSGSVFIGTPSGLQRLDPEIGRFATWDRTVGGHIGAVLAVAMDGMGTLRMAANERYWRLTPHANWPMSHGSILDAASPPAYPLHDLRELVEQRQWNDLLRANRLAAVDVRTVAVAPDGAAWLASAGGGILRQTPQSLAWQEMVPAARFGGVEAAATTDAEVVQRLAPEAGEISWFGTNQGLYRVSPAGGVRALELPTALTGRPVTALAVRAPGVALALVDGQLLVCQAQQNACLAPAPPERDEETEIAPPYWTALAVQPNGTVWLGARDGTVEQRDTPHAHARLRFAPSATNPPAGAVTGVAVAGGDRLWIATRLGLAEREPLTGLWQRREVRHQRALGSQSSAAGAITALAADESGNLYAVGPGGPSIRFRDPPLWAHFADIGAPRIADAHLLALGEGGTVYYGSRTRIVSFTPNTEQIFEIKVFHPTEVSAAPLSLKAATDGGLWLGTTAGLTRWIPSAGGGVVEAIPSRNRPVRPVTALYTGSPGCLIYTTTELVALDLASGEEQHTALPEEWAGDPVQMILRLPDGRLALVTRNGQLGCASPRADAVAPSARVGDTDTEVFSAAADRGGTLWLATSPAGLIAAPAPCAGN